MPGDVPVKILEAAASFSVGILTVIEALRMPGIAFIRCFKRSQSQSGPQTCLGVIPKISFIFSSCSIDSLVMATSVKVFRIETTTIDMVTAHAPYDLSRCLCNNPSLLTSLEFTKLINEPLSKQMSFWVCI